MRKKYSAYIAFFLFSGVLLYALIKTHSNMDKESRLNTNSNVAVWQWELRNYQLETVANDAKYLESKSYKSLFLNISDYIDIYENDTNTMSNVKDFTKQIKAIVSIFSKYKISLYFAAGGNTWSTPEKRYINKLIYSYLINYNSETKPTELVHGIHYDIEPWVQKDFITNKEKMLVDYLDTVKSITTAHDSHDMPKYTLGFAIPFWFDGSDYRIMYDGTIKTPFEHMADIFKNSKNIELTIMAYRNDLHGNDGIISLVSKEFHILKEMGSKTKIRIGQETLDVQPSKLTYAHLASGEYYRNINELSDIFSSNPIFAGISVNDMKTIRDFE